ncbi:hypothetical protein [Microvirga sp. 2TAF3]|uniref:hypothetical protein n=1 Tax=Microvirga sp. 2TAF3 TaxID=3233014 RepID=UPI003F994878
MRFFKRNTFTDDDAFDEANKSYERHLKNLRPQLHDSLIKYVDEISIHDGKVICAKSEADKLTVSMKIGDRQRGYSEISMVYSGVSNAIDLCRRFEAIKEEAQEILYDEIDIINDMMIHRIIFWPKDELEITFREYEFFKNDLYN